MKLGLPAKLAIVLMMASPFANGATCTQLAGDTISVTAPISATFPVCALIEGAYCLVNNGALTVYTASDGKQYPTYVSSAECSSDWSEGTYSGQYEFEEPEPPPPLELPEWSIETPDTVSRSDYYLNTYSSLKNMTERLNSISSYLSNDSVATQTAISQTFASTRNHIYQQSSAIRSQLGNQIANTDYKVQTILNRQVRISDFNLMFADVHASLDETQAALDTLAQNQEENTSDILLAVDDVKNQVVAFGDSNRTTTINAFNELSNQISNLSSGGDGELTVSLLGDISNTVQSQLGETMDGFQALKSNIQNLQSQGNNNTDRIVNAVNNSTGLANIETQIMQTNGKLGGLSGQLGQQLDDIKTAIENGSGAGGGDDDTATNEKLDGLGEKLDGIKGALDGLSDTSDFSDDLAQGTAQGKSDLNQLLDGYDADTMLTDRFKQITDEAQKTMANSGLGKFSDTSKFIQDSGMVKPENFDDLIAFAQQTSCSPYNISIHGQAYQMDLCKYASESSAILNYVFAALTAIFCFVMISQTLINERLS